MSPHHQARFQEALQALDLFCGCAGGWMPVWRARDRREALWWHHTGVPGSGQLLTEVVQRCDELYSDEISIGLPRRSRDVLAIHGATVLWCRIEGKEQLKRARAFRPLPTLVLQEGSASRRLLIWSLTQPLDYERVERANRRIAYRLRAVQKWSVPEVLRIPAPGTCLRIGRSRPVPIVVGRLTAASYTAGQVVGRLKDPPEQKWWERQAGNG